MAAAGFLMEPPSPPGGLCHGAVLLFPAIPIVRWGYAFQFPESFCKKAEIIEAAGMGNSGYLFFRRGKQIRRLADAILPQILIGR